MRAFLLAATLAAALAATSTLALAQDKVVYHVNDSDNASAALRNIGNHLDASPEAKIVVVTHSKGIDFLLNELNRSICRVVIDENDFFR